MLRIGWNTCRYIRSLNFFPSPKNFTSFYQQQLLHLIPCCLIVMPTSDNFIDHYSLVEHIGVGGYGSVWTCLHRTSREKFAVKIVPDRKCFRKTRCCRSKELIPEEVALWRPLCHPSVVGLREVFYDVTGKYWMYVMEYDENYQDLFNYIDKNGSMSSAAASKIIKQVVEVVHYLLEAGVDHRDIKDENILINPATNTIKILDFGSASSFTVDQPAYQSYQGTDVYLPPEYYVTRRYEACPAAVWAIGCLTHCLIAGDCPFDDKSEIPNYVRLQWLDDGDELAKDFVNQCMQKDPAKRPSLYHLLNHPWFHKSEINPSS